MFVRPAHSLHPLRRPERLTEPQRGRQEGVQPWFGWLCSDAANVPDGSRYEFPSTPGY